MTDVGGEGPPEAGDVSPRRVQAIWASVLDWYRSGVHPAIQVCIRRHSAVILNRAIGYARGNGPADRKGTEKVPITVDTPLCVYSTSKAITAFLVHKLIERGLLELDDPVADYIPGYEKNRKYGVTIGHVLAHRSGVPNLPAHSFDLDNLVDRQFMVDTLVKAVPFAKPGQYLASHAVSGGFILGEIVHVVTGKDIRQVLAEEFLDPLGFRWTNYGVEPSDTDKVARNYVTGPPTAPPLSTLLTRALGVDIDTLVRLTNDPRYLTGVVPAANTVTTAWELSRFFEIMRCGGELDGVRVIENDTIRRAAGAFASGDRLLAGLSDPVFLRSDARGEDGQPLRPGHPACVRPPRFHQHAVLGRPRTRHRRPRTRHLGVGAHQWQAHRLSGTAPLPQDDAAHHHRDAEGAEVGDAGLAPAGHGVDRTVEAGGSSDATDTLRDDFICD